MVGYRNQCQMMPIQLIKRGACPVNYLQLQIKPLQKTAVALRELRRKKMHFFWGKR
jgi:hypothetical protein